MYALRVYGSMLDVFLQPSCAACGAVRCIVVREGWWPAVPLPRHEESFEGCLLVCQSWAQRAEIARVLPQAETH